MDSTHSPRSLILILSVAILLIAGGLSFVLLRAPKDTPPEPGVMQFTQENVTVKKVDLVSEKGKNRLPEGFPEWIPVDALDTIFESYRSDYNERSVVHYTVSYTSSKSVQTLFDTYKKILDEKNPTYVQQESKNGVLAGTIDGNDDFLIVITRVNNTTNVQLSFLDRVSQ